MNNEAMRKAVELMYPQSSTWKSRVARMSNEQVYSIYARDLREREREARRVVILVGEPSVPGYNQGTLF